MEIKATLNKPYTDKQRADFIVENNHKLGYEIQETEDALLAVYNEPLPPTKEEQQKARQEAYRADVDPLMAEYNRKKTFNLFEDGEEETLLAEVNIKVEEIKQRFPYPVKETTSSDSVLSEVPENKEQSENDSKGGDLNGL